MRASRGGRGGDERRAGRAVGPEPDEASLQAAALAHLARFEASRADLARVLERRFARWSREVGRQEAGAESLAEAASRFEAACVRVLDRLEAAGALDDARYARRRGELDLRRGRSARASEARLAQHGVAPGSVGPEMTRTGEDELAAAAIHARRRRLGPFRTAGESAEDPEAAAARLRRALGSFARAGFDRAVARQILSMSPEAAEAAIRRLAEER